MFAGPKLKLIAVCVLIGVQAVLFWVSLQAAFEISVFCTATRVPSLELFGYVHLTYLVLLLFGLLSLVWSRIRLAYILLISLALVALPVQVWLVKNDRLYCDAP